MQDQEKAQDQEKDRDKKQDKNQDQDHLSYAGPGKGPEAESEPGTRPGPGPLIRPGPVIRCRTRRRARARTRISYQTNILAYIPRPLRLTCSPPQGTHAQPQAPLLKFFKLFCQVSRYPGGVGILTAIRTLRRPPRRQPAAKMHYAVRMQIAGRN